MIKNIINGIIIGFANIIPGVSGGTLMVILGIFDKTIKTINNVFSLKDGIFKGKKEDIIFLAELIIGIGIGVITFAKIIEFLFTYIPIPTLFFFISLILSSLPSLIKSEMKNLKINKLYLLLGIIIITIISYFAPETTETIITNFPTITLPFLLYMIVLGIIAGAATIFPGVSGSMLLLILGEYYLYKSYAANIFPLDINILLPLGFFTIGLILGLISNSKLTNYLLTNFRRNTISTIVGLIIASSIFLIPLNETYNIYIILGSLGAILFGITISYLLEKHKKTII